MPRLFRAAAEVRLAAPDAIMLRLCRHFAEFGNVTVEGRCSRIDTGFGLAELEACERCLRISATGRDDAALAYVKLALAEHLLAFAREEKPSLVWQGDGVAGQPLPYFREMRVLRTADVTPRMRRVTLGGADLGRFAEGGLHVRLLLPRRGAARCGWPVMGADGRPSWPDAAERPDVRIYTLRAVDPARGEVEIDFVRHGGGDMPGACFAEQARPGDVVGMTGPGGGGVPHCDWMLLAGDETALPAIGRILADLPATTHAVVRIEVADAAEEQRFESRAALDVGFLHRGGREAGTASLLVEAVWAAPWPAREASVYAWAACEHGAFRAIRRFLREERGLGREDHLAVAYWRRGRAGEAARQE